ncbi:MAG TPA: serine/threonine-protein kinase, partial [Anaerolineales bacterium]|nr:serine/threonine-protein kinase [Anaerolineales bacterium]
MTLSTGQTLRDRYRIDSLLGQGGMGAVYKGWDNSLAVACAIKENQLFTDVAVRQFEREARLLATLRHSNLPRVTDHFFIPGQGQYLVMDFIEGEDLKQRIERIGPLPEADVRRWAWDILNALQYLHERGVVHRDIKPANIKIAPDGTAVLVDFGIAKEIDAEDGTTTTGARGLTPGFAPPEQYGVGTSRTDARSDLYAFGATLYNLLTGKIPLDALSRLTQPQKFQPVTAHGISVSQRLMDVIDRAMAMDPDRRFASAEEMRTGKRAATDSTQLPATLPPGETVTPSTTLSPDLSATVAGSTRIVPPITKVATAQSDQTTSPLAAQPRWLVWGGIALVVLITLGGLGVMARVILRGGPAAPTTPTQGPTTELPTTVPLAATADLFISGTQTALAAQSVAITETANAQGTAAGSFALTQTAFAEVAEQSNSGTQTAIAHQVATQAAAATRTTIAQTAVSAFANTQTALALSATSTRTATGTATRTATVTATATNTATFTASPTTPPLPTISLNPASVSLVLGSSADLTVSISIAQSSNTLISLSSSNGSVASTASSVTIPPGATSASFSVDGQGAG